MSSRFSTPAKASFINTYSPMPFDQMLKIGQMKQQRYDQGMMGLQQAEANVEALKYLGSGADKNVIDKANVDIDAITEKYSKLDVSDPFVIRQLGAEINTKLPKGLINQIQESYAQGQESLKSKRRLYEQGLFNPLLDSDPAESWDTKQSGIYDYMPSRYVGKETSLSPLMKGLLKDRDIGMIRTGPDAGMTIRGRNQTDLNDIIAQQGVQWMSTPSGQDEIELYKLAHPEYEEQGLEDQDIANKVMNQWGQQFLTQTRQGRRYAGGSGGGSGSDGSFQPTPQTGLYGVRGIEGDQTYKLIQEELKTLPKGSDRRKYLEGKVNRIDDELNVKHDKQVDDLFKERVNFLVKEKGYDKNDLEDIITYFVENPDELAEYERMNPRLVAGLGNFVTNAGRFLGDIGVNVGTRVGDLFQEGNVIKAILFDDRQAMGEIRDDWKDTTKSLTERKKQKQRKRVFDPNTIGDKINNVNELLLDVQNLKKEQDKDRESKFKKEFLENTQRPYSGSAPTKTSGGTTYVALAGGKPGSVSGIMEVADHVWDNKGAWDIKMDGETIEEEKKLEGYNIVKDGYQPVMINKDGTVSITYKARKGDEGKEKDLVVTLQAHDGDEIFKLANDFKEIGDIPTYNRLMHSTISYEFQTKVYSQDWVSIDRFKRYLPEGQSISIRYDPNAPIDEESSTRKPFLLEHTNGSIDRYSTKAELENRLYSVAYGFLTGGQQSNVFSQEEEISYF